MSKLRDLWFNLVTGLAEHLSVFYPDSTESFWIRIAIEKLYYDPQNWDCFYSSTEKEYVYFYNFSVQHKYLTVINNKEEAVVIIRNAQQSTTFDNLSIFDRWRIRRVLKIKSKNMHLPTYR